METKERFLRFTNPVPFSGCWIWSGSIHPEGYGRFALRGKTQKAHRVSFELFKGKLLGDKLVCHACDEPSCVNPDHLFLGTNEQNQKDKANKGRGAKKLNFDLVKKIRFELFSGEKVTSVARKYEVTHSAIIKVRDNKSWRGV